MATRVELNLNHATLTAMLKGEVADAACRPEAEKALAKAQASAPVASGAYRGSLHIEEVQHPSRKTFRVVANVGYAMAVESMTGNLARSL